MSGQGRRKMKLDTPFCAYPDIHSSLCVSKCAAGARALAGDCIKSGLQGARPPTLPRVWRHL